MSKKIINTVLILLLLCIAAGAVYTSKSVENKIIFLDAGHGGIDGGTIGRDGTYEKDINLAITYILKEKFESAGFFVILSRYGDYDLASDNTKNRKKEDMNKRVNKINDSDCVLFLSIHANSFPNEKIRGAQVLYQNNEESKRLANLIQNSIKNNLFNTKREALQGKDLFILDNTSKIGCLIETGFLSNQKELESLKTISYQEEIAKAIFIGVMEYF